MSRRAAVWSILLTIAVSIPALVSAGGQKIQQALSPSFGDLNALQSIEITDATGQVLLRGTFATAFEKPRQTERTAELTSPAGTTAKGKAEIDIARKDGVITKEEIEVSAQRLPASTNCKLMVDGQEALTFTTSTKGKADLKLSRQMTPTR
jgi:hypothetical protein